MIRRVVWPLVALMAFATFGGLWFLRNFEQVPYDRWEAPQKEALRNPFLALERLSAQMGRPLLRIQSPPLLDELPPGGVLLLDRNRHRHVDATRAARLLAWVERGGYLIVAGEVVGDDPLLEAIGVSRYEPPEPAEEWDGEIEEETEENRGEETDEIANEETNEEQAPEPAVPEAPEPQWFYVRLPDSDVAYGYRTSSAGFVAAPSRSGGQRTPAWQAGLGEDKAKALLHYAYGAGQVTILDGLDVFNNYQLTDFDHAELLWALLQRYQPQGEIRLAARLAVPTLWEWLAESAAAALASALVLIAVWLWRIVPRFGGTVAVPVGERRELSQHLAAIGRSVWREGGIAHWLAVVRQAIATRVALRHPYLMRLDASARHAALARLADCPGQQVDAALAAGQAESPQNFTSAMQTLQRLDQRL